jgi:hypothetical protein
VRTRIVTALLCSAWLMPCPVHAQGEAGGETPTPAMQKRMDEAKARNAAKHSPPYEVPTKWEPVGKSLEQLLNDGYSIASGSEVSFVLHNAGNKWVTCSLVLPDPASGGPPPASMCVALN